jgi:carbon monoxide dehydrogenase subunit G
MHPTMARFSSTITINSDVESVFSFATDPINNGTWQSNFVSYQQTNGDGVEVGATYRYINSFLGMNMQTDGVITEYEPNQVMTYEFKSSTLSGSSRFQVEEKGDKTEVTVTGEADLSAIKFGKKLAEMKAKKQIKSDLKKLKRVLEAG